MNGDYLKLTDAYFEEEKKKYEPWGDPTGHLQELIEQKFKEILERENQRVYEVIFLREEIENLKARLERLEKQRGISEEAEIIEIREIPLEQVKKEMLTLLADGKTRYADEIASELKLDIRDVIEAFKQLKAEGKLFIDGNKL